MNPPSDLNTESTLRSTGSKTTDTSVQHTSEPGSTITSNGFTTPVLTVGFLSISSDCRFKNILKLEHNYDTAYFHPVKGCCFDDN